MKARFNIFTPRGRELRNAYKIAKQVDALKDKYRQMSNEELSSRTEFFMSELKRGVSIDELLPEAMATARESIWRVHGLYAFFVQIVGAVIIHKGNLAEMYTGEGKTLTIILTAYVNALLKKGVHIVTVNEYLVKRDAEFCAQALNPLNISVGYNISDMEPDQKRHMFACDITYTTNSELGFDYLRDNMVKEFDEKVIRDLHMAIIDEVDSILIDESRTPLIISGQPKQDVSLYIEVDTFVKTLKEKDYIIDLETNTIALSNDGVEAAQKYFKIKNLYNIENSDLVHKIRNSLMANYVFRYGVEYIVRDNKILLVDHFTGRILEGRSYNAGLHQAIQAKEMVKIEPENVVIATITYQAFFRLYEKLSGVTGTALTEAEEFIKIYNMIVVPVPTNKKVIRKDLQDYIFETKTAKWAHVAAEIERLHAKGQPVLVGTASVEDSEELAALLRNKGLHFELLNAKNHAREAEIVALAGQKGAITISTNMAGRGTDIKLGPGVKELGGLFVIGTNRHESRRVDNQLCGRSGRQGDPGMTRFFISLEDPLFKRFLDDKETKAENKVSNNEYYDSWWFNRVIKNLQKKVEGLNYDTRKNLTDYDVVLSNQREVVYKQRDQILKNERNIPIVKNMSATVANDLVGIFLSPENPNFVDAAKLANALNTKLLNFPAIEASLFERQNLQVVTALVSRILWISIESRIQTYDQTQIQRVLRSCILQNFDAEWTQHLDIMAKIREGVTLRSLEQKSPLNIYVEEADKRFDLLKKNVAHKVVISIHRLYVPKIETILIERFFEEKLITEAHYNELKTRFSSAGNKPFNFNFGGIGSKPHAGTPNAAIERLIKAQNANGQKGPVKLVVKQGPDGKPIVELVPDQPNAKVEEKKPEVKVETKPQQPRVSDKKPEFKHAEKIKGILGGKNEALDDNSVHIKNEDKPLEKVEQPKIVVDTNIKPEPKIGGDVKPQQPKVEEKKPEEPKVENKPENK